MKNNICFYLNGQLVTVPQQQSAMMLSDFLRYELCLTGTKVVCAEGDCGACTLLKFNPLLQGQDSQNFLPVNSCIMPLMSVHGSHLITVEALEKKDQLHQAQEALVKCHGTQCGFCTPGFVMALAGLCDEKIQKKDFNISLDETKNCLTGNLCRCTGYESIIKAGNQIDLKKEESLKNRYHTKEVESKLDKINSEELKIEAEEFSFYAPLTYKDALNFLNNHQNVKIIANATDLGVIHNKRKIRLTHLLSLHLIKEAYEIKETNDSFEIGSRVTLTELRHFLKGKVQEYADYLDIFASPQIKNNATLVGNIANASPIGDNAPVLLALDAHVLLDSYVGKRIVKLDQFFLDYRKTDMKKNELITKIIFKKPQYSHFKCYKNSLRKDLDISTVNMAIHADIKDKTIENIIIGAGGIAATPIRLKRTEAFLKGKLLDDKVIESACKISQTDFTPLSDVRASASYRRLLVHNYLQRFLKDTQGTTP